MGMTVGPIPWTALNEFVRAREIVEAERFEYLIRALDAAFMESIHRRKYEKQREEAPPA